LELEPIIYPYVGSVAGSIEKWNWVKEDPMVAHAPFDFPIEVSALLDALLKAFPEVAVEIAVNAIARPLVKDENIKQVEIPEFPISMLQSASI
jgi:hypothetical protein